MNLFDDFERIDLNYALYAEPLYPYLNQSARSAFKAARELLQLWANDCPELVDNQWMERFRSDDDRQHLGALFELYTCILLKRQGFELEREPLSPSGKRPEFLVRRDCRDLFFLECVLASGPEFGGPQQKRINRVYDAINRIDSPNFFLGVRVRKAAETDPRSQVLREFLESILTDLDPDTVAGMPHQRWQGDGWVIDFSIIAKTPELRGKTGIRPLAMPGGGSRWVADTVPPLIRALRKKASRYDRSQIPYVIAVCTADVYVDTESYSMALYGQVGGVAPPRGFWNPNGTPTFRRVSAVLFVSHLRSLSIRMTNPILYHNPWASHRLDHDCWSGTQLSFDTNSGGLLSIAGKTVAEMVDLDPHSASEHPAQ